MTCDLLTGLLPSRLCRGDNKPPSWRKVEPVSSISQKLRYVVQQLSSGLLTQTQPARPPTQTKPLHCQIRRRKDGTGGPSLSPASIVSHDNMEVDEVENPLHIPAEHRRPSSPSSAAGDHAGLPAGFTFVCVSESSSFEFQGIWRAEVLSGVRRNQLLVP